MLERACPRTHRHQGLAEDDSLAAERCHFWANGLVASSSLVFPLAYHHVDGEVARKTRADSSGAF